jgi:hypothetical protein
MCDTRSVRVYGGGGGGGGGGDAQIIIGSLSNIEIQAASQAGGGETLPEHRGPLQVE